MSMGYLQPDGQTHSAQIASQEEMMRYCSTHIQDDRDLRRPGCKLAANNARTAAIGHTGV